MSDLAWPTTASGAAVAIFFLAFFHKDIRAWIARRDNHPSIPEPQPPPQPIQLEAALASEQRNRDHEAQIIELHAKTDAEYQRLIAEHEKTIKRLTASNARKDEEIATLKAEVAKLKKPIADKPPEPPMFTGFDDQK